MAFLRILCISLVCALWLTECSPGRRNPGDLEFWTLQLSPTFDGYIRGVIDEFERSHPGVRVHWVDVPFEGITQKLLSAIAADRAPDVINLPADYVRNYRRLGAVLPLRGVIPDSILALYLPQAMRPMTDSGQVFGLPWYLATKILIYESAGSASTGTTEVFPPRTYDGLLRYAREYHRSTGKQAFFYNVAVDSYLLQVLVSEGVPLLDATGRRAAFNTPEAAAILERWVETFKAGAMPRECLLAGHQGGIDLYQSGSILMFVGAPQFLRIIRQNAPLRYASTLVAPAPVGQAGKTELDVMALCLSSRSASPALAGAFAAHMTNAENQTAFAHRAPIFPSVTAALEDPWFTTDDGTLEGRARTIAARQIRTAEVLKPWSGNYRRLQESFKNAMLKAFQGRMSPAASLRMAAEQWTKILQEQNP